MANGTVFVPMFMMGMTVIGGFIIFLLMLYNSKSHRLEVRIPTNKGYLVEKVYWVLERKDKEDKSIWWVSVPWQKKVKLPEPPSDCTDLTRKGKKYVVVKRLSEDEFIYCRDQPLSDKDIIEKDNKLITDIYKPFSVTQRQTLVHQYIKANADKPNNWLKENIMNITALIILGMVVIIGIIYWGDINKTTLETQSSANNILQNTRGLLGDFTGLKEMNPQAQQQGGVTQYGTEKPPTR